MTTFFERLFRYRAREKRAPLEDFLSEVLADFLNQAPVDHANTFIENSFVPAELRPKFRDVVNGRSCKARTQARITGGKYLDIIIEIEDNPLIVIENKLWASFQYHVNLRNEEFNEQENEDVKEKKEIQYDHQLVTYGRWLADVPKPKDWPGVLCVLTHASQPPSDFIPANTARYGAVPYLQLWRSLHGEITKTIGLTEFGPDLPAWRFIGQELRSFLEVNSMTSSDLNPIDISSINVSMSPLRKVTSVFSEIGAELLQRFPDKFVRRGQSNIVELENSRVWGWTYFQGPEKMYLAYGIYFSPVVGQMSTAIPPLADQEQAFLVVGSDSHAINIAEDGLPEGWSRLGDETWLVLKPFPLTNRRNEERFPQFVVRLIQENLEDIDIILEQDLQGLSNNSEIT